MPAIVSSRGLRSARNGDDAVYATDSSYETKSWEVMEIITHITLSQMSAQSSLAVSLGLPPLLQTADLKTAMQIDECLTRFVESLPPSLSLNDIVDGADNGPSAHSLLLHIR